MHLLLKFSESDNQQYEDFTTHEKFSGWFKWNKKIHTIEPYLSMLSNKDSKRR